MDTKQVIARFEAERQALALMDHPNIARVLDAGATPSGRPYFVMELVKGTPITRYCDEHHLTIRQRLELMVPVCRAVQHAHQKGVIHRDLKPSNVLVAPFDGQPVPKVIDFGVAKATGPTLTEKTLVTEFGAVVGTLEYMSPEQAELNNRDIDTRSDVYSLGVLLYELLTGTTPITRRRAQEAALLELLRVIREEEPPRPSTLLATTEELPGVAANRGLEPRKLSGLVRGELDWIVMKALEKDRSRRYETASGLATDLRRYLADEPVLACPPSAGYRLRKFVRRNKRALATAGLLGAMLLVVVAILGWAVRDRAAREQEAARDRATRQATITERVALALEEARKRHKEGRWREALDAAKRAEALAAAGESGEETHQRARETLGDMQMLASLEHARAEVTRNEAGSDLKAEDSGYARAFREYGIDIDALDRDTVATSIRARSIRYELAVFLDSWSQVRRHLGQKGAKAIGKDWKEVLEIARAVDPDPWRDAFRKAVLNGDRKALVELAASAPIASLPAETVDRLGDALMSMGATGEAAAFLKKGQLLHPQDYWINVNLGVCLLRLGRRDEAIRYHTAAVSLRPEAGWPRQHIADTLFAQGKLEDAIAACREAVRRNPDCYLAHSRLGSALFSSGQHDEAIAAWRKAVGLKPDYGEAINNLADRLANHPDATRRDPPEAVRLAKRALELDPNWGVGWNTLGEAHYRAGDWKAAIKALGKSMELRKGGDSNDWFFLTMAKWRLDEKEEARKWYGKAVEWMDRNQPKNEELRRFRVEAAELLELKEKK
jgi:tetratricopeptide (TPR) repeat protein